MRVTLATSFALLAATAAANQAGSADNSISAFYNGQLVEPIEPLAETADDYEVNDNQRGRSGARGRGRGRGLKFLKELAPEVIGPAIVPGIETLMNNQRGGEYEEYYEEDDNQRGGRNGARGRGRGRGLKFLKEMAPEVIGPIVGPGIETLVYNQRSGAGKSTRPSYRVALPNPRVPTPNPRIPTPIEHVPAPIRRVPRPVQPARMPDPFTWRRRRA